MLIFRNIPAVGSLVSGFILHTYKRERMAWIQIPLARGRTWAHTSFSNALQALFKRGKRKKGLSSGLQWDLTHLLWTWLQHLKVFQFVLYPFVPSVAPCRVELDCLPVAVHVLTQLLSAGCSDSSHGDRKWNILTGQVPEAFVGRELNLQASIADDFWMRSQSTALSLHWNRPLKCWWTLYIGCRLNAEQMLILT